MDNEAGLRFCNGVFWVCSALRLPFSFFSVIFSTFRSPCLPLQAPPVFRLSCAPSFVFFPSHEMSPFHTPYSYPSFSSPFNFMSWCAAAPLTLKPRSSKQASAVLSAMFSWLSPRLDVWTIVFTASCSSSRRSANSYPGKVLLRVGGFLEMRPQRWLSLSLTYAARWFDMFNEFLDPFSPADSTLVISSRIFTVFFFCSLGDNTNDSIEYGLTSWVDEKVGSEHQRGS